MRLIMCVSRPKPTDIVAVACIVFSLLFTGVPWCGFITASCPYNMFTLVRFSTMPQTTIATPLPLLRPALVRSRTVLQRQEEHQHQEHQECYRKPPPGGAVRAGSVGQPAKNRWAGHRTQEGSGLLDTQGQASGGRLHGLAREVLP